MRFVLPPAGAPIGELLTFEGSVDFHLDSEFGVHGEADLIEL